MKPVDDIVALYSARNSTANGAYLTRMREIRDTYNGDVILPLPELDTQERPAVANLLNRGLDQHALRISSTMPTVMYPSKDSDTKQAEKYARIRRDANTGWWEFSAMNLQLRLRARHFIGYGWSPTQVRWNPRAGVPIWVPRDPLGTFPAEMIGPHDMCPSDAIFAFARSFAWIKAMYPQQAAQLNPRGDCQPDTMFNVIEYVDAEETVMIALGSYRPHDLYTMPPDHGAASAVELERVPNRAGVCTAVVPRRIVLDRPMGQFDGMVGMYQVQAKLMALEVIAVEKGIFPDQWLVARPGETPAIIAAANGLKGDVGIVRGGELRDSNLNPGFMTNPTIDRLERAQRLDGGIPQEFGGESTSNVRTGRRGDAVLSAVVDFPVQEAQDIFARSLQAENKVAVAIAKAYAGNVRKSFYVSWKGAKGRVDYTPNTHFDTDENVVSYSHPGADMNALVVSGGQRLGMGTMSKRRFMEIDPLVDDPETEHDRVIAEGLEDAALAAVQQQAAQGAIPLADLTRIIELVVSDKKELPEAVAFVQREAQERQASEAPPGAPETMPGLSMPGMGAEQPSAAPEAAPSLQGLLASLGGGV